jgi:hypothetical protein
MDPKFNRFLKETKKEAKAKAKRVGKDLDETEEAVDNSSSNEEPLNETTQASNTSGWDNGGLWAWSSNQDEKSVEETKEPSSLYELYRREGDKNWLKQDNPAARGAFNLINTTLHPESSLAKGVAVLAAKGTSFEDKRINCLETIEAVKAGENSGEIELIPDKNNEFDQNAVGIFDKKTGRQLGFIPKAKEVNKTYAQAIAEGKFCGGYIIDSKKSYLKGEENTMIIIITGWTE